MELYKCPWCGAPYTYRENLELHEKGCPERPAAQSVSRYVLPVELQREWIGARERSHPREWSAGLRLVDEQIEWFDFEMGEIGEAPAVDATGGVGSVHYHANPFGEPFFSFTDEHDWLIHTTQEIPPRLNPIFFATHQDDRVAWVMLPKREEILDEWRKEIKRVEENIGKTEKLRIFFPFPIVFEHAVGVDINSRLWRDRKIRMASFTLGVEDQIFYPY